VRHAGSNGTFFVAILYRVAYNYKGAQDYIAVRGMIKILPARQTASRLHCAIAR